VSVRLFVCVRTCVRVGVDALFALCVCVRARAARASQAVPVEDTESVDDSPIDARRCVHAAIALRERFVEQLDLQLGRDVVAAD
jgi:hypothetical protein